MDNLFNQNYVWASQIGAIYSKVWSGDSPYVFRLKDLGEAINK